jgi:hemerythrin-like metal-binding protein
MARLADLLSAGGSRLALAAVLGLILWQLLRWLRHYRASSRRRQALAGDLEVQMATRTAELQESDARLQGFLHHAGVAIGFKGLDGRLLLANREAEEMISLWTGAGRDPADRATLDRVRQQDERILASREAFQFEDTLALPDGGSRDFLIQKFPLLDATGHCWGIGFIGTDITERKLAEQAHLQHQKLESIGLLAGGIAHDFNNLLGAISGNLELANLELGGFGPAKSQLRTVEELVARATGLVAQILAYSGRGQPRVETLDLNGQVEGMIRLLRASLARNAALQWQPGFGLPAVKGDPAQIQQVLMNLVLNASDAVAPRGGTITIRTGLETLSQALLDRHFPGQMLAPGKHLTLEVSDDGAGMAPEVLERIFDPFFTTKFTGRGLGLSAVQGILRAHGGGIQVESSEGEGTRFKLVLPALATPEPEAGARAELAAARFDAYQSHGTVLVVDDEDALRAVAAAALGRCGFDVLEARDGLEALRCYAANRDRIRLVLMDLTMPNMDGEQAYRELRQSGAWIPVVLTSGLGKEEAIQRFDGQGLAGFLQKPFRFQEMIQVVQSALGEAGGADWSEPYRSGQALVWNASMETGIPILDAQHRGLVDRYNQVVAATGKDAQELALHELIGATVAHFGMEEDLMSDGDYPEFDPHKAIHEHLVGQIQDLAREVHRGLVRLDPPTFHYLEGWLLTHQQFEDAQLAEHLSRMKGSQRN